MQKLSRNILVAASAAAVMGAVVVGAVARYGAPQVDKEKMECAHMHVHDAMYNYSTAYDTAWRQSADTLNENPEYQALAKKMDVLNAAVFFSDDAISDKKLASGHHAFQRIATQMDSIEDALRTEHMMKNPELIHADSLMRNAIREFYEMQRVQTVADSLNGLPLKMRLANGWRRLCRDWHSAMLDQHQKRLQNLEPQR